MQESKKIQGWSGPCAAIVAVFGLTVWIYFLYVFVSAILFVVNLGSIIPELTQTPLWLSKGIDYPNPGKSIADEIFKIIPCQDNLQAYVINIATLSFFAIPHSFFARGPVKKILGEASMGEISAYRSIYVLQATIALHLLQYCWQPIMPDAAPLWDLRGSQSEPAVWILFAVGIVWLLSSTFAIDHMDLFGVKQSTGVDIYKMLGLGLDGDFVIRAHFHYCRHPIMWGFFCMFFITPVMTINHLFFAIGATTYILIAVSLFEEPDLRDMFGEKYAEYEKVTPGFCPFTAMFRSGSKNVKTS